MLRSSGAHLTHRQSLPGPKRQTVGSRNTTAAYTSNQSDWDQTLCTPALQRIATFDRAWADAAVSYSLCSLPLALVVVTSGIGCLQALIRLHVDASIGRGTEALLRKSGVYLELMGLQTREAAAPALLARTLPQVVTSKSKCSIAQAAQDTPGPDLLQVKKLASQ